MKICIISSRFYPKLVGSGTIAYLIAETLTRRGHEVTVLTDQTVRNLREGMNIVYPFSVHYIDGLEDFANGTGSQQIPTQQLYGILHEGNYDIVQVCNFMSMFLVATIRKLVAQPIVFSFYNTPNFPHRAIGYYSDSVLDMELASFILKSGSYDALVAGSRHYYDSALKLGAPRQITTLSFLGVDVEELSAIKVDQAVALNEYLGDQIKPDDILLMLPSRITEQKGIMEAVQALAKVKNRRDVKLLLTGMSNPFDTEYAHRVIQLAHDKGVIRNIVTPLKLIPRGLLAQFYLRADIIIVPSHYEGLGLSAIEALALGRPLIAANARGLNEIAFDSQNALLFVAGDSDSLARTILRCLDDEDLRNKIMTNAKDSVRKFGIATHVDHLEKVYLDLQRSQTHG